MDVVVFPEIYRKQQQKLVEFGLEDVFKMEMACLPGVIWLELSEIKVDLTSLELLKKETKDEIADSEISVKKELKKKGYKGKYDFSGLPLLNLKSNAQVLDALKQMGLNVTSTGDEVLATLNHPAAAALRKYMASVKLMNTFIEKYPEHVNTVSGRIHAAFNQYGAETGRFSCSAPSLQQVPNKRSVRNLFVSEDHY